MISTTTLIIAKTVLMAALDTIERHDTGKVIAVDCALKEICGELNTRARNTRLEIDAAVTAVHKDVQSLIRGES